jgi:PhzF family phenazine biosynthesis protein
MSRAFVQVDVFAEQPFKGNPLAVVFDADGLADAQMSEFARWTNLSETTFVLPPTTADADYRVRIFTSASDTASRPGLGNELPFAGHPTLGTCHAWLARGGRPRSRGVVVQECGAGLVTIKRDGPRLAFAAPPLVRPGPVEQSLVVRVAEMLRVTSSEIVDAEWVDNGPGWLGVLMRDADTVLALEPSAVDLDVGVVGPYAEGPAAYEVRAFFPRNGATAEDPVTGSLNAALAQWLIRVGRVRAPYVASQGAALGRAGRVHIDQDADGTIWVGGAVVTVVSGGVEL